MKILLINKFHYKRGGSETYYFALAEALIAKGHKVIYFAMQDEKNLPCAQSKYFVSNVDYNGRKQGMLSKIKLGLKIFYSFEAKEKMKKLIREEKPDVAHIGLIHRQITFSVVDVLKKYNIPIIMTMHDLIFACPNYTMLSRTGICEDCMDKGIVSCVKKLCIKDSKAKSFIGVMEAKFLKIGKYYNKIDLYIAECEQYKALMKKSKFTKSKIINMTNFLPINQEYKFNEEYKDYILYFGRFSKEKGILTLLKAHKQMECKYKLIIVGDGLIKDELQKYIDENRLTNVELLGAIYGDEMEKIIERSRIIVVPSEWYENCPYSILQSIAKGKVVIASRIGGLPELIEDKKTGYLFEAGNADDLEIKINFIMQLDRKEYEKISYRILYSAKEKHYWEKYIDELISKYMKLIRSKKCVDHNKI
ncbi:glycosyltransferase [Clostridium sp. PL3]|uniref:Glycosyltransferase n=1 Tax=Clostridium thailandense TaxID=2794346 RepID=A0A949TTD4_9CLOT|nr:glycosyltransferase [Clostridium thailandense]MBV7271531.1 glycosyltransferase [Clostridium thailandense]